MFVHGVDFFTFCPGALMLYIGLLLTLPVSVGKVKLGPITLSLYWQLLGVTFGTLGLVCLGAAAVAKVLFDYTGIQRRRWLSILRYTRTAVVSAILFVGGLLCALPLVRTYVHNGFALPSTLGRNSYLAVTGLFLVIASVIIFIFTLLVHAAALASRHAPVDDVR
jgi:hypothetical protein